MVSNPKPGLCTLLYNATGPFPVDGVGALTAQLKAKYPFLTELWLNRLLKAYGSEAFYLLGDAKTERDLGRKFGTNLTECELNWLVKHEFASAAEDIIWCRSELVLRMASKEIEALCSWMADAAANLPEQHAV